MELLAGVSAGREDGRYCVGKNRVTFQIGNTVNFGGECAADGVSGRLVSEVVEPDAEPATTEKRCCHRVGAREGRRVAGSRIGFDRYWFADGAKGRGGDAERDVGDIAVMQTLGAESEGCVDGWGREVVAGVRFE